MRHIGLLISALLLAGCASAVKDPVSEQNLDSWKPTAAKAITQEIGLISDTQFHESRGYPSPILQGSGDEVNEVTIRSAQQVIGADDVLQRALVLSEKYSLLLHAGDALDISCSTEWRRFERAMLRRGAPGPKTWVYTPGNHDGYLTGNLYPPPDEASHFRPVTDADWVKLCNAGMLTPPQHAPFRKNDVIEAYVKLLGPGVDAGQEIRCSADGGHCWVARISRDEPWESFIVQLVQLPAADKASTPIYALLLDSSNYRDLWQNESISLAGLSGGLLKAQITAALALTNRVGADGRYFFVAHYPMDGWHLNASQRRAWDALANDPRSLNFIITSHTHDGELAHHKEKHDGMVELNTGSLADPPVYMRTLQFEQTADGQIGFRSTAKRLMPTEYDCKAYVPAPVEGPWNYSVDTQRTELSSLADWTRTERFWRRVRSAAKGVGEKDEEKHQELRPQLLMYADIVSRTFPATVELIYDWPVAKDTELKKGEPLAGRTAITERLRKLALCREKEDSTCTIPRKENLLLALEKVYRETETIPVDDREFAHRMRLCMALEAAEASPSNAKKKEIKTLRERTERPWSMRLSPRPTVQ